VPTGAHPAGMPALAVAFLKRYWVLLQEVLDVRVMALLQSSLEGCARAVIEKNKPTRKNKTTFLFNRWIE